MTLMQWAPASTSVVTIVLDHMKGHVGHASASRSPALDNAKHETQQGVECETLLPQTGIDEEDSLADIESLKCTTAMTRKPEILSQVAHLNGLRAMAFIGVFLFHFRYGCQGGFLGVDVFFVLSGYLMTRSISNKISCGTYTYASFLARRFWRLFPALLFTIILSMCLAYGFFSNEHALQTAKSALASVFGVSNLLFLSEEGYFGTESVFKPLLHTWSLSVEWQFYLIWPVLMSAGSRFAPNSRALWPLVIMCCASFLYSVQQAKGSPMAAFFTLPSRAFEFGLGAVASLPYVPRVKSPSIGNAMSIFGSLLIVSSFQFINYTSGAPAIIAMPSLLGAMFIALSPTDIFANRIFMLPVFDYMGKISYSAYLVHWPIFVFYQNIYEHTLVPWHIAAAVVTGTLIWSAIMFHIIEDEYRIPRKRHKIAVVLGLFIMVIAMSANGIISKGWSKRVSPRLIPVYESNYYIREYTKMYLPTEKKLPGTNATAIFGAIPTTTTKSVNSRDEFDAVLIGDSFCAPLAGVFNDIAMQSNKSFLMISHHSCAAFFDKKSLDATVIDGPNAARMTLCKAELRPEMLELVRVAKSKVVVISSNWFATSQMWLASRDRVLDDDSANSDIFNESQLEETVKILNDMGRKVIVIGVVPGSHFNVRACLAASGPLAGLKKCPEVTRFKIPFMGTAEQQDRMERRAVIRDTMRRIFEKPRMIKLREEKQILLIDPYEVMCNDETGECLTSHGGEPYYSDDIHLTANATMLFRERIRTALDFVSETPPYSGAML
jgi:peptidoglycan/LPS O-acetylase OafA/YrhL